jgi:hypothetical protein
MARADPKAGGLCVSHAKAAAAAAKKGKKQAK